MAFHGPYRHKVVSLDGTQFNKSGQVSGGYSASMHSKAGAFNDAEIQSLKDEREALQRQLQVGGVLRSRKRILITQMFQLIMPSLAGHRLGRRWKCH